MVTVSPMGAANREDAASGPQVAQWYAGKSVLVTGATGFLGKAIIEKLLRSCPDIATIYMLMRPKRGQNPQDRLAAYTSNVVFSKVRAERPDFERHLSVIAGDLSAPDFRVEEQDLAALRRDVSVVFHGAASVRFDESLRTAVTNNVLGTKRILQLAERLPNLQVFLHLSTSFCHSHQQVLEEKLYPALADPEKIMDIVTWMDDDLLATITPKLLRNLPNTYALTKNLTEELVARYSDRLPIVIARPSIVGPAWKEPLEGWSPNTNGPTGLCIAAGKGVLRTLLADFSITVDCIPVDFVTNAIIIVAWHVTETRQQSPFVCNITNGGQYPVSWKEMSDYMFNICREEIPFIPMLWYPHLLVTTSFVWYSICHLFLEVMPAHILDFLIMLSGRKPFLVAIQKRLETAKTMLQYYMVHEWTFINKTILSLYESLAPEDKETFYFNPALINLYVYLKNGAIGAKVYILNENLDNIPSDLRQMRRMYWLHTTLRVVFYGLLLWLLYTWSQPAMEMLDTAIAYLISVFNEAPIVRTLTDEVSVPYSAMTQDVVDVTNSRFLI